MYFRKPKIKDDGVELTRLHEKISLLSIQGAILGIPGFSQSLSELLGQGTFVFD